MKNHCVPTISKKITLKKFTGKIDRPSTPGLRERVWPHKIRKPDKYVRTIKTGLRSSWTKRSTILKSVFRTITVYRFRLSVCVLIDTNDVWVAEYVCTPLDDALFFLSCTEKPQKNTNNYYTRTPELRYYGRRAITRFEIAMNERGKPVRDTMF